MLRVFILDDEPMIRQYLLLTLPNLHPMIQIVGVAGSVAEAILMLKSQPADLLLLDIELPDGVSFELFETFPEYQGQAIFITAHNDFAIRAIKHSALDYLLKPIDEEELEKAIHKAVERKQSQVSPVQLKLLQENYQQKNEKPPHLILKNADAIHVVKINEIIRLESESNYTTFYSMSEPSILVSKTLKEFTRLLEPHNFFRCHQSHLINLDFVQKINKYQGLTVILKDGTEVPISSRRKEALLKRFA